MPSRWPAVLALVVAPVAGALEGASPAGLWETYDDASGLLRALVRISERDGRYVGVIEQVRKLPGDKDEDAVCRRCDDHRKDQPIRGMTILTGLRKAAETYDDGRILDPGNGVEYRCRVRLIDDGRRLEVRGVMLRSPAAGSRRDCAAQCGRRARCPAGCRGCR